MDHDRAEGEGVAPQEYTAIKIELLGSEWTSAMQKTLKKGSKVPGMGMTGEETSMKFIWRILR